MLLRKPPVHQQAPGVKTEPRQQHADPDNTRAPWVGTVSAVMSLALISFAASARGQKEIPPSPATRHSSVMLIDELEHLPSLAWKAVPFSLSHDGIVNIDVQVVRGNPIDVFLTTSDQIDNVKKVEWNNLKIYGDITATGTKAFSRGVRLGQGGFYLVVRDMTIGTPSSLPSEISVKVRLNPSLGARNHVPPIATP